MGKLREICLVELPFSKEQVREAKKRLQIPLAQVKLYQKQKSAPCEELAEKISVDISSTSQELWEVVQGTLIDLLNEGRDTCGPLSGIQILCFSIEMKICVGLPIKALIHAVAPLIKFPGPV